MSKTGTTTAFKGNNGKEEEDCLDAQTTNKNNSNNTNTTFPISNDIQEEEIFQEYWKEQVVGEFRRHALN